MNIQKNTVLLLIISFFMSITTTAQPFEIYVSPAGNDQNPGTNEQPLLSVMMAQRKAREMRRLHDPSAAEGIRIILKQGTYRLYEPLLIRPEDSGTEGSPTIFMAETGSRPVISGGVQVSGWKKSTGRLPGISPEAAGKIWEADIPSTGSSMPEFRQMWVNGQKAVRASSMNDGELDRIISVDRKKESFRIPVPGFPLDHIERLEFVIHQWWAIAILRVKEIKMVDGAAEISFHQPESRIEFEHPWPAPFIDEEKNLNGNSAFYFTNSISLLNSPGEWYEDMESGKIYYWPRKSENLQTAEVIVPFLESVVSIDGTLDNPVSYIQFKGISFEHTTWMRPSKAGHVPLQAGMYIYDAYKLRQPWTPDKASLENQAWTGRQPAGVCIQNADHLEFRDCDFRHMAATGLDLVSGTHHNRIEGCIFSDIGGTAIQAGFFGGKEFEAHLPYDPADTREVCRFETISNNLVTNVTNEDWGCVGISIGYAHDISIENNEVSYLNYSGICVGWGWTKTISCMKNNRVHANHIHHFARMMYDVGGIYTLSAQPNTLISENSIHHLEKAPYAHIPEHYQYIYFDEGSSYIRAVNNWTEKDKFFSNSPGPGNEWKNNGPQVSPEIREKAGLKPEYKHLLEEYNRPDFPFRQQEKSANTTKN